MDSKIISNLASRLMRCPAAPYHEQAVRAEAESICNENGFKFERDRFGNLLVQLNTRANQRCLILAAHLDHPGFSIIRRISDFTWLARFQGGVPENYFHLGTALRLLPDSTPARLGRRIGQDKTFEIRSLGIPKSQPSFAVWELEDFALRQGKVHGRACDDLIGAAAALATLIELKRAKARVNCIAVLSRAEEVGFHGALTVANSKILPRNGVIISLETSRELPGVRMGKGVIVRVGDRTSIFDSEATRFLTEVASELKLKQKTFQFQRALMSGGTCEATAYQEFGYVTAAVCVALGNYHNCGRNNRIKAEYVSLNDVSDMVALLASAAKQMPRYAAITRKLPLRLKSMLREAQNNLRKK
jgi:putative aminopeptidase FrvX